MTIPNETMMLSGRDRALLRAVRDGRCTLGAGCGPVLLVDGLACADSIAVRRLFAAGLIDSGTRGAPAELTPTGRTALDSPAA